MTPEMIFEPDARLLVEPERAIHFIEWDGRITDTTRGSLYARTGTSQHRCGSCHVIYPFDEVQPNVWTFIKRHACRPEVL